MAFLDPIAVYSAGSNIEANLVCGLLNDAGIEAQMMEDDSQISTWFGGIANQLHNPQVWVERSNTERARMVVAEYERRAAERRAAEQDAATVDGPPIEVLCEECNKRSYFPVAQRGSVQNCPHCNAYVDVGDDVEFEGWDQPPGDDAE